MGSFNVSDVLTGATIDEGEKVVAIVLARSKGGYPDADRAAATRPIDATHLFQAASLPIRGTCDGFGGLVPDKRQYAVTAVLEATRTNDWKNFTAKAFDFSDEGGVQFTEAGREPPFKTEVLGLAFYKESSWRALTAPLGEAYKDGDVETVAVAVERSNAVLGQRHDGGSGDVVPGLAFMSAFHVHELAARRWSKPDGTEVDLPAVASALDHNSAFAERTRKVVRKGALSPSPDDPASGRTLREAIRGVWEVAVATRRLLWMGRLLQPSVAVGQFDNVTDVADASFLALEQCVEALERQAERYEDDRGPDLSRLIERLDALRDAAMAKAVVAVGPAL